MFVHGAAGLFPSPATRRHWIAGGRGPDRRPTAIDRRERHVGPELAGLEQGERGVAVAGDRHVMSCPFQEQPDGVLYGRILIHDQDVGQIPVLQTGGPIN